MKLEFLKSPQLEFLKEGLYLQPGETAQQRFKEIVDRVRFYESMYSEGLADRIEHMLDLNILSLSTPAISNFGRMPQKGKSMPLPASCNIITVGNSIKHIAYSNSEVKMLSKLGAGVGLNYDLVCQKNTKLSEGFFSNSKLDWIEDDVRSAQKVSQGATRRGYATPFLSIEDADFDTLMNRVKKNNPDKKDPLINNTIGIILPIGFRAKLSKGDEEAQRRYLLVLSARKATGKIYMMDEENSNINSSLVYKKLGLSVRTTNICTEFLQPLFTDKTSVCVVSALNLIYWNIIKDNPQMVKDAIMFLDILNEEYILLSKDIPFLDKARRAAMEKRDIGLGTLGFAELLQMNKLVVGDIYSRKLNKDIFKFIRKYAEEATLEMGIKLGSPKICEEAGMVRRNASLMMQAPNKSTAFISGNTSGGGDYFLSNIFMKTLANIQHILKNPHLEKILIEKGLNTIEIWDSIQDNNGSVQHLEQLSQLERDIFKTSSEISPKDMIDMVADRQEFIDMGQSFNLTLRKNYSLQDVYEIHKYAWEKGIKTLYYAFPSAHAALEKDGKSWDDCASCAD